jgi:hypothetical protein
LKNLLNVRYANALIIATVLMVFTMVLHPMGGSIEYIQKISGVIMGAHALAILSIPFWILGFWGLTKQLKDDSLIALTAFIVMVLGLFAVLLAATINGLALPLYANHYIDATPEKIVAIKPVIIYNGILNHAFDLVYIAASAIAILLWSITIVKTKRLPAVLGWFGIMLPLVLIVPMIAGVSLVDLTGFRIFVSGFAIWTIFVIISLRKAIPLPATV